MPLLRHISRELLEEVIKTPNGMQQRVKHVHTIITDRVEYTFEWDHNALNSYKPSNTSKPLSTVITKCKKWALTKGYQLMSGYDLFNNGVVELTFDSTIIPNKIIASSEEQAIIDICELILKAHNDSNS